MTVFSWLPQHPQLRDAIAALKRSDELPQRQLKALRQLTQYQLDLIQVLKLDAHLQRLEKQLVHQEQTYLPTLKLAILGSSTTDHLLPAIRIAALRHGLQVKLYNAPYGQYRQEILQPDSGLYQFHPDVVLVALHPQDIGISLPLNSSLAQVKAQIAQRIDDWQHLWQTLQARCKASVVHQTLLSMDDTILGHYDALVPATPANLVARLNQELRDQAAEHQVLIFDLERLASTVGRDTWCNPSLWHHSKQEISPSDAPLYGEHLARILAAVRGLSHKCLVLDLDNTLWGGVIGDDGLAGIQLGQGSALGEAFQAFQRYIKALKARGIILAVCSKNDKANALDPFLNHPEMVLKREDISIFVANWENKASNLEHIAASLNIGLDSLVFFDDNPVERGLVRKLTPDVAVPEVPEDPAYYVRCLASAGYFEAVSFSSDDVQRTEQYLSNQKRHALQATAHSIEGYLEQLQMEMVVAPIDEIALSRTTQLINKSNQFNLTTRRYTQAQVQAFAKDPEVLDLQIRLKDSFGDNGLISVVLAKPLLVDAEKVLHIDTWLMSCRVLGRQVECEVLNVLVEQARQRGCTVLQGEYLQTAKNEIVQDHYQRLGFEKISTTVVDNKVHSLWRLHLQHFVPTKTQIRATVLDIVYAS
jgi:FkbH-like protein